MRTCTVPSCDRPHKAKGYCTAHYYRLKRHGDPLEHIPVRQAGGRRKGDPSDPDLTNETLTAPAGFTPPTCSVEGCDREADSPGWCRGHYRRWLEHGDIQADIPFKRELTHCSVEGCQRVASARGLCFTHYQRWRAIAQ